MSKKMPKGYSVKTISKEGNNFVDQYGWQIIREGEVLKESLGATHFDSIDARKEGVAKMWEMIKEQDAIANEIIDKILAEEKASQTK